MKTLAVILLALLATLARAGGATTVDLRPGVRVAAGEAVTLATIARIDGPLADQLGVVVLEKDGFGAHRSGERIGPDEVLRAIGRAMPRDRHAIVVRGVPCTILVLGGTLPTSTDTPGRRDVPDIDRDAPLVRMIEAQLRMTMNVGTLPARFEYDQRDAAFLNTPLAGRTVELVVGGRSDRVPVRVVLYDGDTVSDERAVRVGMQIERRVVIAQQTLRRGHRVGAHDLRTETRWVGAGSDPADPTLVGGLAVKSTVRAGEVIDAVQLEPPEVIKRGDIVVVRSLTGSAVVRLRVRALASGRVGEVIEFRREGTRQTLTARVAGPGLAVIAPPPALRADSKTTDTEDAR